MSKWEKAVKGAKDHNLSLKAAHEKTQLVRIQTILSLLFSVSFVCSNNHQLFS